MQLEHDAERHRHAESSWPGEWRGGGKREGKAEGVRNVRVEKSRIKWRMEQQEYHSQLHCFTWWNPSLKGQLLCNSPRLTR